MVRKYSYCLECFVINAWKIHYIVMYFLKLIENTVPYRILCIRSIGNKFVGLQYGMIGMHLAA